MHIRSQRDFWAGVMFLAIGLFFVVHSQAYQFGSAARMGPGFFPTMLGVLMILLGLLVTANAYSRNTAEDRLEKVGWRELALILVAITAFAIALPVLGMVPAIALLIGISGFASHEFRPLELTIETIVLLVMSYYVFVKGLSLQFPIWPTFLMH